MIKQLSSTVGIFKDAYKVFEHPKFGPLMWLFCFTFWFVFFLVKLPYIDKTGLEYVMDERYENWRVHSNATKLFYALDNKYELEAECKNIKDLIYRTEQSKWSIMGSSMPDQLKSIELAKIESRLREYIKKLEGAESIRLEATRSYEELLAKR